MHSTLVRIQNLFGFFTTVTFAVAALVAMSSMMPGLKGDVVGEVKLDVRNVQVVKGRAHQYPTSKPAEFAFIKFDLEADLTPLFNWNTKQIFAYIAASYPGTTTTASTTTTPKYEENDAIIWDIIIPSKSAAKLKLRNTRAKYNFNDVMGKFSQQNATLTFGWNVQPHVGLLTWNQKGVGRFRFPDLRGAAGAGAKKTGAGK